MKPSLVLALAILPLALAACGGGSDQATAPAGGAATGGEAKRLNVYNWSDYVADSTIPDFEKRTGIRVTYDVYSENEVLDAKLKVGRSGYDVVFPTARPFAERQVAAGLYAPLDKTKLPNWKNLDPAILRGLEGADPGNAHLVPYMWHTTGIGYNPARVKAALGDGFVLDSWTQLFDPEVAGKLKSCGLALLDDEQEGFAAALFALGKDPNSTDPADIEAAAAEFAKIRPFVRYFNNSQYINDLANGDVCVALGYSGDVVQARDRAAEAGRGVEIDYVVPKEGALRQLDVIAVPADAPHTDNAFAFIDYLLEPAVAAAITDQVHYASANTAARALVSPAVAADPSVYPDEATIRKLVDPATLPDAAQRERVRTWTRIKSGR
jgi:putrescine transport system substrate-binding protein